MQLESGLGSKDMRNVNFIATSEFSRKHFFELTRDTRKKYLKYSQSSRRAYVQQRAYTFTFVIKCI